MACCPFQVDVLVSRGSRRYNASLVQTDINWSKVGVVWLASERGDNTLPIKIFPTLHFNFTLVRPKFANTGSTYSILPFNRNLNLNSSIERFIITNVNCKML